MRTHLVKLWCLAAALTLGGASSALADIPNSSGPGTLGVEVPYDSRLAREYYQYFLPTDTQEALWIRDRVQELHVAHQTAIELGRAGATAQDAELRRLAQRIVDELRIIDSTLVDVAKDSLIELTGTASDAAAQAAAGTLREVQAAAGPERDRLLLSSLVGVLEGALARVEALQPRAKEAHRQQLGSILARDRKVLRGELAAARPLAAALPAGG